jgi:hypothetical protein
MPTRLRVPGKPGTQAFAHHDRDLSVRSWRGTCLSAIQSAQINMNDAGTASTVRRQYGKRRIRAIWTYDPERRR